MGIALKNEDEFFQNHQDETFWVNKFDALFLEFIKSDKMFILDTLSLRACRRLDNIPIIEEFQQNCNKGYKLKDDEIISLCAFIKYQNEFFDEHINGCKWKIFYKNLCNAICKMHNGMDWIPFPEKLYCHSKQIRLNKDQNILSVNSVSYWTTKPLNIISSGGKQLELNDVKEFLFHRNKNKCKIIGVPVQWNDDDDDNNQQWILMPFIASSVKSRQQNALMHYLMSIKMIEIVFKYSIESIMNKCSNYRP